MKRDRRTLHIKLSDKQKEDAIKLVKGGMSLKEAAKATGISYSYLATICRIRYGNKRIQRRNVFPGIVEWMNEEKLSIEKGAKYAGLHPRTFEDRLNGSSQFRYEEIRSLLAASGQDFETLFREF